MLFLFMVMMLFLPISVHWLLCICDYLFLEKSYKNPSQMDFSSFVTMSSDTRCIHCNQEVRKRQQALQCGGCDRWQHRTCETGISQAAYREAVNSGGSIDWSCVECENQIQHSSFNRSQSGVSLVSEEIHQQLESTRTSSENGYPIGQFELEISNFTETSSTRALERSDFDVTRDHRSMIPEVQEESINDESINRHDVSEVESAVTFEVVENGSTRGKRKLVSSDGFTFVHKKILKNGTDVWRCSVRGKKGELFETNNRSHIHQAKPGIGVAVKIKTDLKAESRKKIFDPSGNIVREVMSKHHNAELPEAARPLEVTLKRLV